MGVKGGKERERGLGREGWREGGMEGGMEGGREGGSEGGMGGKHNEGGRDERGMEMRKREVMQFS